MELIEKNKKIIYETVLTVVEKSLNKDKIVLLKNVEVLQWMLQDFTFLHKNQKVKKSIMKELEDKWGKNIIETCLLKNNINKMWSGVFGEALCKELLLLLDFNITKPKKIGHIEPDLEIDDFIIEIKNGTYFTGGTAHEKILGTPYKYRDVHKLYNKSLFVICLGQAEKYCREIGFLPGEKEQTESQKEFMDFFNKNNINFIGSIDLIDKILYKYKSDVNIKAIL